MGGWIVDALAVAASGGSDGGTAPGRSGLEVGDVEPAEEQGIRGLVDQDVDGCLMVFHHEGPPEDRSFIAGGA